MITRHQPRPFGQSRDADRQLLVEDPLTTAAEIAAMIEGRTLARWQTDPLPVRQQQELHAACSEVVDDVEHAWRSSYAASDAMQQRVKAQRRLT